MNNNSPYIPGLCNIGQVEIKVRLVMCLTTAILSIGLLSFFIAFPQHWIVAVLFFLSLSNFILTLLQVKYRFCVKYAFDGVFNFSEFGNKQEVGNPQFHKIDKQRARKFIIGSYLVGLIVTIAVYWLFAS
ncbi:MAG: hypothetical protein IPO27_01360 [Bacteroidetes bacterium]|nr:hypothetical protein [Bacteroidota bacterium]